MRWIAVVLALGVLGCATTPKEYCTEDGRVFSETEFWRVEAACENEATIASHQHDFESWSTEYEMRFEQCMRRNGFVEVDQWSGVRTTWCDAPPDTGARRPGRGSSGTADQALRECQRGASVASDACVAIGSPVE